MAKLYKAKSRLFQEYGIPEDMVCTDIELDSPHIEYVDSAKKTHCTFFKILPDRCIEIIDRYYDERTDTISKENLKITKETARIINEFLRREQEAIKMQEREKKKKLSN